MSGADCVSVCALEQHSQLTRFPGFPGLLLPAGLAGTSAAHVVSQSARDVLRASLVLGVAFFISRASL